MNSRNKKQGVSQPFSVEVGSFFERDMILLQDTPEVLTELLKYLGLRLVVRTTQTHYGASRYYELKKKNKTRKTTPKHKRT